MANITPVILTLSGMTASATGVSLSQTVPGAAGVVMDGAYASGYSVNSLSTAASVTTTATLTAAAANISPAAQIVLASTGDESGKTFVIVGKAADGYSVQSETIAGPKANSRTATTKFFSSVTSVTISAASVGNVSVGVNGVATITAPRRIRFVSGGTDTGITFTVTGTDPGGDPISEIVTGGDTTTVNSTLTYKTITSIVASGATASTLTVGSSADGITGGAANSLSFYPDQFLDPFNIGIGAKVTSGTATFSVQHSFDNVYDPNWLSDAYQQWGLQPQGLEVSTGPLFWADNSGISGKTAADGLVSGNYAYPVSAIRINIQSGTGTVTCWIRQAGAQ